MEAEQNTSLPYDILTGECEAAIRKHLAPPEIIDADRQRLMLMIDEYQTMRQQ